MCFLSGEWEFVLVCTGSSRQAYFFFMEIGSRCEPLAFASKSLSGVCMAGSVVCLNKWTHLSVIIFFFFFCARMANPHIKALSESLHRESTLDLSSGPHVSVLHTAFGVSVVTLEQ